LDCSAVLTQALQLSVSRLSSYAIRFWRTTYPEWAQGKKSTWAAQLFAVELLASSHSDFELITKE
jgi:hypothetical protein